MLCIYYADAKHKDKCQRRGPQIDLTQANMTTNANFFPLRCLVKSSKKQFALLLILSLLPVCFFVGFHYQQPSVTTDYNYDDVIASVTDMTPSTNRYVIGWLRSSSGRLGNEMFVYASVLGMAATNGMRPWYHSEQLRHTFNVSLQGSRPMGPVQTIAEQSALEHDRRFDALRTTYSGDVTVVGYFQSWKYFESIRSRVRREFTFLKEHSEAATIFLRNLSYENGLDDRVFVGVHIRRDDMLQQYNVDAGYTVADEDYLERSMTYVTHRLQQQQQQQHANGQPLNVVFVVCSDDLKWSKKHVASALLRTQQKRNASLELRGNNVKNTTANSSEQIRSVPLHELVVYSPGFTTARDLAILSLCNHTIMTVGTFGWWAAYLAGGITVYYKNFPAAGSKLEKVFSNADFFPPEWVGL